MNFIEKHFRYILLTLSLFAACMIYADLPGLNNLYEGDKYHGFSGGNTDGEGLKNVMIHFFKNLAIALFILAALIVFISAIMLLISENSEEDFKKWMSTLTWWVMWLIMASITYTVIRLLETRVLWEPSISGTTMYNTVINIVYPVINFIRFLAAAAFFMGMIYWFYVLVTANGNEEGATNGKNIFLWCLVGFIIMYIAEAIVKMSYGSWICSARRVFGVPIDCTNRIFDTVWVFGTVAKVIIFLNSFIALVVLILIIYAWFLILTGSGDEEKYAKFRRVVLYATIGIIILILSYAIYRFILMQG